MQVIKTVQEMQSYSLEQRARGRTVVLVPTMGYLHEGHASLLREGRKHADVLVMSLFVNPMQFGPQEDLAKYPRDFARDSRIAEDAGTDIIFFPGADQMYPGKFRTSVQVAEFSDVLCGKSRPGHFRGVTTVVAKLFNVVVPHRAIFGEKDFQQLVIIRQMVDDLNMPVEVMGMPIVREKDGLAMSSRNTYLSADERRSALSLSAGLFRALEAFRNGQHKSEELVNIVHAGILAAGLKTDYIEVIDETNLASLNEVTDTARLVAAVYAGSVRLIDNIALRKN